MNKCGVVVRSNSYGINAYGYTTFY